MSLARKAALDVGIYPIPHFSDRATVTLAKPYQNKQCVQVIACLGFLGRDLSLIETSFWSVDGSLLRFGTGEVVVPNGAEWWSLSAPKPPKKFGLPDYSIFRVRWELHT